MYLLKIRRVQGYPNFLSTNVLIYVFIESLFNDLHNCIFMTSEVYMTVKISSVVLYIKRLSNLVGWY
jgi:hypothetical protein